jgi:hypothetical protein
MPSPFRETACWAFECLAGALSSGKRVFYARQRADFFVVTVATPPKNRI